MNEQRIPHELLEEGLDDWLPVDRLVGLAGEPSEQSGEAHRDLTERLLAQLVGGGLMRVGDLGETGFEAWPGDADAVVRRVMEALDAVAWAPAGGVCWLANTPVGDREVSGTGR
ncbi:hypothetical protein IHE56_03565 [Streptomyces sp. ID01-12c]|uniref:hypothetical protein n=1 Tax=Streptomyces caniscabiei TaxID=2746961 RepID=UPI001784931E|nr:hypothetical protein [Streptomyces caniscabiei]MBD9701185.1 hypothetical protein [Streptomyces caniscabiei]MDX3726638.1 hypothetical protein [Streptomyces caniscabiei]